MTQGYQLSGWGRAYIAAIIVIGGVIAISSVWEVATVGATWQWFILALLTLASGSFTVRIPTIPARLSVSETFVFAAVLMFGPSAATVIVLLDTLVISFWLGRRLNPLTRLLFNGTAPATAIWVSSQAFYVITGIEPLATTNRAILPLVFPILGLALLYFLLNSWLIAFAVGFQRRVSAATIWRQNFLWLSLNYFSGASVAALLLPYLSDPDDDPSGIAVIFVPLLLISYLTFRTALGRVDDATKHLEQLNRLYLSTIETLAMAIDAKDQITHGHIRRVQRYAVKLASALGVKDQLQIKAIEAASLLHDMGKLAVPEYILNKPGRLTTAEFERMKTHASIGAEILSSIEFPYPVVPIVRHHHENWDGTGYPDGLKGTEIPVGARILAVVDCFDALTSDRPYRPRLSDEDAIAILRERRAVMYDPLVVDSFLRVHCELARAGIDPGPDLFSVVNRSGADSLAPTSSLEHIASSAEESLAVYSMTSELSACSDESRLVDVVSHHLRRMMPVQICALYLYDSGTDELVASAASGDSASLIIGLSIPRGQRLSGWVAANLRTIANSDAVLDLGDLARSTRPRLSNCIAAPLCLKERLLGVLTLYSAEAGGFSEDHRRIVELVANQVAVILDGWAISRSGSQRAVMAGNEPTRGLSVMSGALPAYPTRRIGAVLVVSSPADSARSDRWQDIVEAVRHAVTAGDIVVQVNDSEVVAFLISAESGEVELSAQRLAAGIGRLGLRVGQLSALAVGVAKAPNDGVTSEALTAAARSKRRPVSRTGSQPFVH